MESTSETVLDFSLPNDRTVLNSCIDHIELTFGLRKRLAQDIRDVLSGKNSITSLIEQTEPISFKQLLRPSHANFFKSPTLNISKLPNENMLSSANDINNWSIDTESSNHFRLILKNPSYTNLGMNNIEIFDVNGTVYIKLPMRHNQHFLDMFKATLIKKIPEKRWSNYWSVESTTETVLNFKRPQYIDSFQPCVDFIQLAFSIDPQLTQKIKNFVSGEFNVYDEQDKQHSNHNTSAQFK